MGSNLGDPFSGRMTDPLEENSTIKRKFTEFPDTLTLINVILEVQIGFGNLA
ncbi:MAG: hypothetical protein ACE5IF_00635 [Candidatus Bathyarchaeia archaeon]